jgi:hypothetical protein
VAGDARELGFAFYLTSPARQPSAGTVAFSLLLCYILRVPRTAQTGIGTK